MKIFWQILSMAVIMAMMGCEGNVPAGIYGDPEEGGSSQNQLDEYAPCTDITTCCPEEKKRCFGNPDDGTVICTCSDLWDCNKYPQKCVQDIPTPNGSSGWECKWTEFKYTCSQKGTSDSPPAITSSVGGGSTSGVGDTPSGGGDSTSGVGGSTSGVGDTPSGSGDSTSGGGGSPSGVGDSTSGGGGSPSGGGDWFCKFNASESKWECTKQTPTNPSNKVNGTSVWECKVDLEINKLSCERTEPSNTPPSQLGGGQWNCNEDNTQCSKEDNLKGLPSDSGDWTCHMRNVGGKQVWVCTSSNGNIPGSSGGNVPGSSGGDVPVSTGGDIPGSSGGNNSPGGGSWQCKKTTDEFGNNTVICEKPMEKGDYPKGDGWWSCEKGTEFGGTVCHKVEEQPTPQGTPGGKCAFGEKMWCDGLTYCGWGIVACDEATGTWKTKKLDNGKLVLDCQEEHAGGKVPKTQCACFHYYFNPSCCERPDCIVPDGTDGWVCPKSEGKLCNYCNPQKPECSEAGAKCIVTNDHETFCGRDCSGGKTCPSGFTCMEVTLKNAQVFQCVPADYSCYY